MILKVIPFFCVIFSLAAVSAQDKDIDPRFTSTPEAHGLPHNCGHGSGILSFGNWKQSSLSAHGQTLWTNIQGARAVWNPDIQVAGKMRVSVLRIKDAQAKNDPNLKIEVLCRGKVSEFFLDCENNPTGWVELGVFDFEGAGKERFHLVRNTPEGPISRCGPFLVEILDPTFQGDVTSKYRLIHASEMIDMDILEYAPPFKDLPDVPAAKELGLLFRREIHPGTEGESFFPDKPITTDDFYILFDSVLKPLGLRTPRKRDSKLTLETVSSILDEVVRTSNRNIEWLEKRCDAGMTPSQRMQRAGVIDEKMPQNKDKSPLNRFDAFLIAKRFMQTFVLSGPPVSGRWKLTFEENFDGNDLDWSVWTSQNGPSGHILSSRWKENVEVEDGLCKLVAKKETRAGQDWTAASIWVKKEVFSQTYGYWEARYRYGAASGLNQSFWMEIGGLFEIDVNEGHWPNKINTNLHWFIRDNGKKIRKTRHEAIRVQENLADDFHTYGCLWTEKEIVYYFDGEEIFRKPSMTAQTPVWPILSLAVLRWAGTVTDEIDGKSMDVDWVRVYGPDHEKTP